jgi:hypothetical protein
MNRAATAQSFGKNAAMQHSWHASGKLSIHKSCDDWSVWLVKRSLHGNIQFAGTFSEAGRRCNEEQKQETRCTST